MLQMYPAINRSLESLIDTPTSLQLGIEQTMLDIRFVPQEASHIETLVANVGVYQDPWKMQLGQNNHWPHLKPVTLPTNLSRNTTHSLADTLKHFFAGNHLEHSSTPERRIDQPVNQVFKVGSVSVLVYSADITTLKIDAIVNAANRHLGHGSGVSRAIHDAAGDALDDEGRRYVHNNGPIPVSGVVRTTAGRMPCRMVLHAVGPAWNDYKDYDKMKCEDDLCKTILRCLIEATNAGAAIVAIPAISSGIFCVPKQRCCNAYVRATKLFGMWTGSKRCLTEVHFVDKSESIVHMIATTFSQSKLSTITPRPDEERFMKQYMKH
ncbi:protein mono-ADP-ribosyltransferase PARP9-like [Haliotis rubra]|uniref:protein mono-ADP-ribosyltransferase PARP9-like n=1 Tax=Haliotis rubra TaxID=36100 RepID=UPI001EE5A20A|nr:protein mono-ADP-ribosyltransferase PARP9-like [Haliotis rubra]XP_046558141.1 protein mono-ADP-ribosyltransferase PARP9-like [Haliotis rubra]XP_046569932.1 protein mono-ADP-ribosyltransferase PARP9-like [Haliotis rubra]XP_046569933.1 protein mono-ADP-ribosyltransferase PARP9-like [Haliotis rubra]